jgi:NADPH2:quinone reductase
MRALVCNSFAPLDQLRLEDVETPEPLPGQVRIRMMAAALNFMDTLIVQGRYQYKPPLPFSPGAEMAGIVTAVGDGVHALRVGDRVMYRGQFGSLAEERLADAQDLTVLPQDIGWQDAAAMPIAYTTALHGLQDRADLQPGETVLVLGAAGGVGIAAIQVAKAMGACVIAVAGGAAKGISCKAAGADVVIDHQSTDLRAAIREATDGRGADVVVDTVGGGQADASLRGLARNGRYLVVGFASGSIPALAANLILVKNASVFGVTGDYSRNDHAHHAAIMKRLFDWLSAGLIRPLISEVVPLADAPEALRRLALRQVTGKIVVVP